MRRCAAPRSATSTCSRAMSGSPSQYGEIVAVGHGFELRPRLELSDDAVIVDAHGMVAIPGLRRLPHARLLRRRSGRRVRQTRARRHLRGAPRGRRRHPLDRRGDAHRRPRRADRPGRPPPALDARARHDVGRDQVRLRARPRERARHAARDPLRGGGRLAAASSRPCSPRTPCRPRPTTPTRTSSSASTRSCPRWTSGGSPRTRTCSASVAPSTSSRRGATCEKARELAARAATARRPVHRRSARSRSRSSWPGEVGRPPRGDRARGHRRARGVRRDRRDAAVRVAGARSADAARRAL